MRSSRSLAPHFKLNGNKGIKGQIHLTFQGAASQSYGAFICQGMHFSLFGEANDFVGKGMNGGELVIQPQLSATCIACQQVTIGNTCLYGATGRYLFANGQAGERFAVRNSSAKAVVECTGDHDCEYMTGGVIFVIGKASGNIGAGMTGGIAYFLDENSDLLPKVNNEIVVAQQVLIYEGEQQLREMLEMHALKTGSEKATDILNSWSHFSPMTFTDSTAFRNLQFSN